MDIKVETEKKYSLSELREIVRDHFQKQGDGDEKWKVSVSAAEVTTQAWRDDEIGGIDADTVVGSVESKIGSTKKSAKLTVGNLKTILADVAGVDEKQIKTNVKRGTRQADRGPDQDTQKFKGFTIVT